MGIAVRKEEIGIMKYIGATDAFVRAPFLLEGMVLGVVGAAVPLICLLYTSILHTLSIAISISNYTLQGWICKGQNACGSN